MYSSNSYMGYMKEKNKRIGYVDRRGYVVLYKPRHANSWKNQHIHEHVFVMSEHLRRPLKKGENVHHINGDRADNRVENLELWHRTQPSGQRLTCKIKDYSEFLSSHGYKVEKLKNVI